MPSSEKWIMRSANPMLLAAIVLAVLLAGSARADFSGAVAAYNSGDYEAALAEFEKLAAEGDPAAMNNLAFMYAEGQAVKRDYARARDLYTKAAKLGNLDAMNNLGVMYELGQGVGKDYKQAAQWYDRAASKGHRDAQYNLAALYASGNGVGKDLVQAYLWYGLAAARGDKEAALERDMLEQQMTADQRSLARQKLQQVLGQ